MKIVKKLVKKSQRPRDLKKERVFRLLAECLRDGGFQVRREELKRGPNWRVVSGSCRSLENELIFVDRRLEQDEQIAFLLSRILELGVEVSSSKRQDLPKSIVDALPLLAADEAMDIDRSSEHSSEQTSGSLLAP